MADAADAADEVCACGCTLEDDSVFCRKCGARRAETAVELLSPGQVLPEAPEALPTRRDITPRSPVPELVGIEQACRDPDASRSAAAAPGSEPTSPSAVRPFTGGEASPTTPSRSGPHTEAIDLAPPSKTAMANLGDVLKGQFDLGADVPDENASKSTEATKRSQVQPEMTSQPSIVTNANPKHSSTFVKETVTGEDIVKSELEQTSMSGCKKIADNKFFTGFFMALTFYALFALDIDLMLGNKESKHAMSIVTTAVVFLFTFEVVVQSFGRHKYAGKAYFWLDIVALISLLPDTYIWEQWLVNDNTFVAGRSSKLSRLIRIASRGSKVTRLNRLTRIVRVASLMPKMGAMFGRRIRSDETEKVLQKKLRRVFMFLDEDMDGKIPMCTAMSCLTTMREEGAKEGASKLWGVIQTAKNAAKARINDRGSLDGSLSPRGADASGRETTITNVVPSSGAASLALPLPTHAQGLCATHAQGGSSSPLAQGFAGPSSSPSEVLESPRAPVGNGADTALEPKDATLSPLNLTMPEPTSPASPGRMTSMAKRVGRWQTAKKEIDRRKEDDEDVKIGDDELVDFAHFKKMMLADVETAAKLRKAIQQQLRAPDKQNQTSKHSEYVAVKVALGVLFLLVVLGIIEPDVQDLSVENGLEHIGELVGLKMEGGVDNPNMSDGDAIPRLIHDQVTLWRNGVGYDAVPLEVIYLDIEHRIYCHESIDAQSCTPSEHQRANYTWGVRTSMVALNEDLERSGHRLVDIQSVWVPDVFIPPEWTDEEVNIRVASVVVLNNRGRVQQTAVLNTVTTLLVIMIIMTGIFFLTKDMSMISRSLLKPLRELAEDMESIAQLQLAGVSSQEDTYITEGTSEIRLIRRTFENMKKAIKSWGKYVPWPVVQILLRANVEASLEVNESEVTIFFSDIASFTTIVENLDPQDSLLLLSRYFNDMSKVIDDHGGVVIEFIGDAILCVFGAPMNNPKHHTFAVKASLRMLASLRRMNEWSATRNLPPVHIRCGVHTGRVLVGNMGFNSRMKYGVVGEESHIPGKLEEMNKNYGTDMLISSNTYAQMDRENFVTRPVDYVSLRAGCPPETVYNVLDRHKESREKHPLWPACSKHAEAMDYYRQCEFHEAKPLFQEVGQMFLEVNGRADDASALMVRRCDAYIRHPPPADWDGSWSEPKE